MECCCTLLHDVAKKKHMYVATVITPDQNTEWAAEDHSWDWCTPSSLSAHEGMLSGGYYLEVGTTKRWDLESNSLLYDYRVRIDVPLGHEAIVNGLDINLGFVLGNDTSVLGWTCSNYSFPAELWSSIFAIYLLEYHKAIQGENLDVHFVALPNQANGKITLPAITLSMIAIIQTPKPAIITVPNYNTRQ